MNNQKKALAALGVDDASRPRQPGSFDGSMVSPLAPVAERPSPKPDPTRAGWNPKAGSNPVKTVLKPDAKAAALKTQRLAAATGFDPGPRPKVLWLDLGLLEVDHSYQRPLQPRHAKKIAAGFRWSDFQPVTVTDLGNGRYAAIDGQHRLRAALSIPEITDIPCYIIERADVREQARTFLAINGSHQAVSQIEKFRAGLVAANPDYLAIDDIMKETGVRFVGTQAPTPMRTKAVGRVVRAYQTYGSQVLRKTLMALATAWPREPEAFASTMITTLSQVFSSGGAALTVEKAVAVLRKIKPTEFMSDLMVRGKQVGKSGQAMVFAEFHSLMLGRGYKR